MLHLASDVRGHDRIGGRSRVARTSPGRLRLARATAHLARRRRQPRIDTREARVRLRRARRMSLVSQGGMLAKSAETGSPSQVEARGAGVPIGSGPIAGGKGVGALYEILQKVNWKTWGVSKTGVRLGYDALVGAARNGQDVIADSEGLARKIAKQLSAPGRTPDFDPAGVHSPLPHYHPVDAAGRRIEGAGHIFFKSGGVFNDILDLFGPVFILPEQLMENVPPEYRFPIGPPPQATRF